ncbi:MAG: hypothetical protein JNM72_20400 [Deltaproteobacteria bacterium]|nr:hypothetical protein [Deltaproteobacteria bacterium]
MRFWAAFDLEAGIKAAWQGLRAAPLPLLLGGALMTMFTGGQAGGGPVGPGSGGGGGGSGVDGDLGNDLGDGFGQFWNDLQASLSSVDTWVLLFGIGLLFVVVGFAGLLWAAAWAFLRGGWLRLHEQVLVTGAGEVGALFSGGPRFRPMLGLKLLTGLVSVLIWMVLASPGLGLLVFGLSRESWPMGVGGGLLALLLPLPAWIWWSLRTCFAEHAVALDGLEIGAALRQSAAVGRGHQLNLLVWFFVMRIAAGFVGSAGLLLCCVGVVLTLPAAQVFAELPLTRGYLLLSRGEAERARHVLPR